MLIFANIPAFETMSARFPPSHINRRLRWLAQFVVMLMLLMGVTGESFAQSALSAEQTEFAKKMSEHPWELSNADRSKTCLLTLKTDATPRGLALTQAPGCVEALPFLKGVSAWSVRGLDALRLVNGEGQSVMELAEVENSIFEGQRSGEGIFLLQNAEEAREAMRTMDNLVGNWAIIRAKGTRLCRLTLTNTPTEGDNFALFTKPPCESPVATFAPLFWRLERGVILMIAKSGETWRFEPDDLAQWRRVPEDTDQLMLERQ